MGEVSWYTGTLGQEGALLLNCKWRPCCPLPFFISNSELKFYVECGHSPVLRETTRAVSLWHFLQASLFSARYSQQAWPFLCLKIYIQTTMRFWGKKYFLSSLHLCIYGLAWNECHAWLVTTTIFKASFHPHGGNSLRIPMCLEAPCSAELCTRAICAQEPSVPHSHIGLGVSWALLSQGMLAIFQAQPHHHHLSCYVHSAAPLPSPGAWKWSSHRLFILFFPQPISSDQTLQLSCWTFLKSTW